MLTQVARVLLGAANVLVLGAAAAIAWSEHEREVSVQTTVLDPASLSQDVLAGVYRGRDGWLALREGGTYEYTGGWHDCAAGWCGFRFPSNCSVGEWAEVGGRIELRPDDGSDPATLTLLATSEGARLLTLLDGQFVSDEALRWSAR